ncbi:MAG: tetratricopeptide repeat protein [Bacteroidia bacterium]|nr:tetratricopeptide repeat protein [Bacteroidia bacterium]
MRIFLITVLLLQFGIDCNAQNYFNRYEALIELKDTTGQKAFLRKWETESPRDPELYVCYYNYYIQKSMSETLSLVKQPIGVNIFELADSAVNDVGYLSNNVQYNPVFVKKAMEYIEKGIKLFPDRLDLRFGKIYILGEMRNYKEFTTEIIKAIQYSDTIKNAWLWSFDERKKDGKTFFLENIHSYVLKIYDTNDDKLLENMKQISESVLSYYPDHIQSLSNISVVYMIRNQYDLALTYLLRAEKVDSKDFVVLANIAHAYKLKGDKKNAIKYYKKTQKHGDADTKDFAREQIAELKKS